MTGNSAAPVLILTNAKSPQADAVVEALSAMNVPTVRWHTETLNSDTFVEVAEGDALIKIPSSGRSCRLSDVRSIWFDRPLEVPEAATANSVKARIIAQESSALLKGLYGGSDAVWYSPPDAVAQADLKPFQLFLAKKCGFDVPPYLMSNNIESLRRFIANHERIVVKPISEASKLTRIEDKNIFLFVRKFAPDELHAVLPESPVNPIFLQRYVEKVYDARVAAIGRDLFTIVIKNPTGEVPVDWRQSGFNLEALSHTVTECPADIADKIHRYMKESRLNLGGFDFAIDKEGRWWFLECNANGQWLWLELESGLDLTTNIAEHLALARPPLVSKH